MNGWAEIVKDQRASNWVASAGRIVRQMMPQELTAEGPN